MVLDPIWIFRPSRIAARTSASQTKSTGGNAAGAECSSEAGAGAAEQDAPAPAAVSQPNPVFSAPGRRARNRSTTSAARLETGEDVTPAEAGMPRAAR